MLISAPDIMASVAAVCTTIAFLPQIIKIYKMKETRDLSLPMYIVFSFGVFMWALYGIAIKSVPVIAANVITFIFSIYILAMKLKYK